MKDSPPFLESAIRDVSKQFAARVAQQLEGLVAKLDAWSAATRPRPRFAQPDVDECE